MDNQIIITSGKKYIDIDAYGGIFAYKKLLQSLGYNVFAVTTAKLNESVSNIITELDFQFDNNIKSTDKSKFILLDVSNPDFFDIFVDQENIIEIIDHHTGYEDYWKEKNVKSQIEFIGSICTIIFEKYIEAGRKNLLTESLCKILAAGILDNTLNLNSGITTDRDREAYKNLLKIGKLDDNWANIYFNSCYQNIEQNLEYYIKNDIKIEHTNYLLPDVFGQLIVLQKEVIFDNLEKIMSVFKDYDHWVFNVFSLYDGKSYLLYSDPLVKDNLLLLLKGNCTQNCIVLDKCLLRKEIIKLAREYDAFNKNRTR